MNALTIARFMETNEELVKYLQRVGVLKTPRIIEAFRAVDRKQFVKHADQAYRDEPLPIGWEQTISQPRVVAFMLELLQPMQGESVLDIGSGSGYTTALLAHIVGVQGRVIGVEKVPELVSFGWRNVEGMYPEQAEIRQAGQTLGLPEEAPFDRILVSAAAKQVPEEVVSQLKHTGVLVLPVQHSVIKLTKHAQGNYDVQEHKGFRFVPLV